MRFPIFHQNWFYVPYVLVMIICGYFLIQFSKADVHIWLNQHHTAFFDVFFKYLTALGNGGFLPVFIFIMVMIKFRDAILLVVVFLLSGLVVQILKRFIFVDVARPAKYFEGVHQLYFVQNVDQLCCKSFPSGHSATAFGIFICFAFVTKKNWLKFLMLILACLVAYSRVYLSQHFLIDTMAGSFIGIITAIACYPWIYSLHKDWLNKNLLMISRKKNNE
jgi:membrane-associated phospholipid phosphatase